MPQQSAKSPSSFAEAESLLQQGNIVGAKAKIQEKLALNPSSVEGYNLLGIVYSDEKDFDHALDAFQHALKLNPASTKTRNNLGNVYVTQQKFDLAEKEFRKVVTLDPANRDGHYNLGLMLMAKGSPAEAIPHFLQVRPLNMATRFNLVRAYLLAGRPKEGLAAADQLSAHDKNSIQLHFTLGVLLASAKQYDSAQRELEKANALQPETFEILFNLGQAYLRSGDSAKAEVVLNRALKLKPDSAETSLPAWRRSIPSRPKPWMLWTCWCAPTSWRRRTRTSSFCWPGSACRKTISRTRSRCSNPGLKIAPKRADLHAALGESYFMSGKTEKGHRRIPEADRNRPSARSYAFLGLSYRHLGRFDEARKYFQEGLKLDPHNASCLFNMGYIEGRQGNQAAAEQLFQQALKSNPDFSEALLELANLRIADKKFEEAATLLRRYVKVSRDPASGYYKLAMVERSLHQTEAAQRDLSVFQTLSKDSSPGPYPYQHLFEYLDNRSNLAPQARTQLDQTELVEQIKKHPDRPQDLYLLAETYLKLGKPDEARQTIAQLDQISSGDYRTQTGVGVLLARYRLYDDAIQHFQTALRQSRLRRREIRSGRRLFPQRRISAGS